MLASLLQSKKYYESTDSFVPFHQVTYFQILGSFTMFTIEWPSLVFGLIVWIKSAFKFEVMQLPGLSCLWHDVSFERTLLVYTIAPLIFVAAMLLPLLGAFMRGIVRHHPLRWRKCLDNFWTNMMFVLFFIYPAIR